MNKLNKALVGTATAAAMAVSATPAMAKDGRNGGPSAGEVIAGVAIIGAIAAIASSGNKDRKYSNNDYRGDRYQNDRYRQISQRQAVNQCVRAAENGATYRGRANVTDIRDVDRTRNGYRIKGNILVEQNRGRYQRNRYSDKGKFTCYVDGNRVSDVQFSGLKYARR